MYQLHSIVILFIVIFFVDKAKAQGNNSFNELLAIKGINLTAIEVTERESEARGILFDKVIIFEANSIQGLYPVIVYTSAYGSINSEKYREIKKELRDVKIKAPPYDSMGFIFEGEDEAFVILDSVKIASNDPPTPDDPIPWQVRRQTGISIIGSLASKNIDFHIFIIGPKRETAELLPDYRRFFETPLDFRKFGAEIYKVADQTGLLEKKTSDWIGNLSSPRSIEGDQANKVRLTKENRFRTLNDESEEVSGGGSKNKNVPLWVWLLGTGISLFCFLLIRLLVRNLKS